jgi:hypothetical protein
MDRKEFLFTIWKKGLKPIILVLAIYFCISFIYQLFAEGISWNVMLLILSLAVLILFIELLVNLFSKIITNISARLPQKLMNWISLSIKYFSAIVLALVIYLAWQKDWVGTAIIIGVLLIQKIIELLDSTEAEKELENA